MNYEDIHSVRNISSYLMLSVAICSLSDPIRNQLTRFPRLKATVMQFLLCIKNSDLDFVTGIVKM